MTTLFSLFLLAAAGFWGGRRLFHASDEALEALLLWPAASRGNFGREEARP